MRGAKVYQVLDAYPKPHSNPLHPSNPPHKDTHIVPDCNVHLDAALPSTEGPINQSDSEEILTPPKSKGCCLLL